MARFLSIFFVPYALLFILLWYWNRENWQHRCVKAKDSPFYDSETCGIYVIGILFFAVLAILCLVPILLARLKKALPHARRGLSSGDPEQAPAPAALTAVAARTSTLYILWLSICSILTLFALFASYLAIQAHYYELTLCKTPLERLSEEGWMTCFKNDEFTVVAFLVAVGLWSLPILTLVAHRLRAPRRGK